MNVKMKRYAKALVAFVLALAMVSEAWGGLSFVSEAETSAAETTAETGKIGEPFPICSESDYVTYWTNYNFDSTDYYIETVDQLGNFAKACRSGRDFSGITIRLVNDLDYGADETYGSSRFFGIGRSANSSTDTVRPFSGTFDGQGYKVIGLTGPLFGYLKDATVKNFTVDGATVGPYGTHKAAVVAMYSGTNTVDNVHVTNKTTVDANAEYGGIIAGTSQEDGSITISNCTVSDSTLTCSMETSDTAATGYGIIVGNATGAVTIENTTVTGCAINISESTWASNVGGLVGTMAAGGTITGCSIKDTTITGAFTQAAEPNPNQNKAGDLLAGVNPDNAKISENLGGVIGYVAGKLTAENVVADNADITMANVLKNVGGFVGYITYAVDAEESSTFTNCSVKNANIVSTQYIWDAGFEVVDGVYVELPTEEKHYYHNIAGFAACVDKKATFTKCTVDNTVTQTQTRYRCGGGLIGSTFSYKTNAEGLPSKGIIEVSQCAVTHTTIKTGNSRNCNVVGGLIALLSEGSTVTDCYVYDYASPANSNSLYVGGLIGDIYDIQQGSDAEGKTVVKNCFVGKTTLQGYNFVGPMIGDADKGVDLTGLSNLLHCKLEEEEGLTQDQIKALEIHVLINRNKRSGQTPSTTTFEQVQEVAHESLLNRELAFLLNCGGSDGEVSSDVWMQGAEYPVFNDNSEKPIRKVIFQAEGESFAYYTNAQGKLDAYPQPDDGYEWWGYPDDTVLQEVFEENTWIYQKLIDVELTVSNYEKYKDTETDFYISDLSELVAFEKLSVKEGYTFEGQTIHLVNDLDMSNVEGLTNDEKAVLADWPGIGTKEVPFGGTFNGHGFTISNLKSTKSGLFYVLGFVPGGEAIAQPTVKNFTLDNASLTCGYGGALVVTFVSGKAASSGVNNQVLNVHVTNSSLTSNGGACAVIVGLSIENGKGSVTISGCTATNCTMTCTAEAGTGVARWGFIMGRDMSGNMSRIVGCTATNCTMISNADNIDYAGGILGDGNSNIEIEECIVDGCTIECAPDATDTVTCVGGVVGALRKSDVTLRDCVVTGTTITLKAVATDIGLAAGQINGGVISGEKVNNSTLNLDYATDSTQSGRIGGVVGSVGLLSTADTLPTVEISNCELEGNIINLNGRTYAVGGLTGRVYANTESVLVKDSCIKNTTYNATYTVEETSNIYNLGGAIGQTQRDIVVKNVSVEGFNAVLSNHANEVGGFIGTVEGSNGSTFENCKVIGYIDANGTKKASSIKQTNLSSQRTSDYTHHFGGFAALATSPSTFTTCYVESMDVTTNVRTNAFGGIVASTYKTGESTPTAYGIVTINRCSVIDVSVESTSAWLDHRIGGVVGALAEGSTVTNCLVSEFTREANRADNAGILIGRIHNSDSTETLKCTIKNCYLQNSTMVTTDDVTSVTLDIGQCAGMRVVDHIKYYNCTAYVNTTTSAAARYATVVEDVADLTDKDLAYDLNTTNETEPHNGSWAQGATNPVIATEDNYPVAYVTYLRYNGDSGYEVMEYLKFPISPDGTIDYANGKRTYVKKTTLTTDSEVNRQELDESVASQEPIDWTRDVYRESMVTEDCSYTGEPTANSGRVWQYPEGKITTDVTITQIEKTAWDFNGDTELSVSDLVRLKKSEKANYNGNVCKASVIGTMLTTKVFDMTNANSAYAENQDLDSAGYLPSYRLRRVILTPPSTEVSVLSYNMYYDTYENLDDETRQDAIMSMLGLSRPADNETLSTRGDFTDNTSPKADIIALQEVAADYWHQTLYKEYLSPWQVGTDANNNDKIDPSEVTSKTYYTYKHVGRGRYGHVFYNTEGSAFAGDSYSLILYNKDKYEYDANAGQSGTFYLSDTPTVASHGWGDTEVDSVLDSQRAANWAIFTNKETGERFMFVSLHLSHNDTDVDRQIVRMKQIELILRRIKEILGQSDRGIATGGMSGGMPVIIAGDFNAYIGTDAYSYAMENGYEDARETAVVSTEKHGAFNMWTQTDETKYAYGDHFLVNKRCEVQTYEVIDGDEVATGAETDITYNLLTGTDGNTYHMSDHCPIRATIDVGTDYIASTTSETTGNVYNEVLGLYQ